MLPDNERDEDDVVAAATAAATVVIEDVDEEMGDCLEPV